MGFICQKGKIRFLSELNKFFLHIVIRARKFKGGAVVRARRQIQTVNNVLNVDVTLTYLVKLNLVLQTSAQCLHTLLNRSVS